MLRKVFNRATNRLERMSEEVQLAIGDYGTTFTPADMDSTGVITVFTDEPNKVEPYLKVFARNNRLKLKKVPCPDEEMKGGWEYYLE